MKITDYSVTTTRGLEDFIIDKSSKINVIKSLNFTSQQVIK